MIAITIKSIIKLRITITLTEILEGDHPSGEAAVDPNLPKRICDTCNRRVMETAQWFSTYIVF